MHVLERGIQPLILEQGGAAGHAVRAWGHVPMFSNWRFNIDAAAARRLAKTGWQPPEPEAYPTGAVLVVGYLEPVGQALGTWLRLGQRVVALTRVRMGKSRTQAASPPPS